MRNTPWNAIATYKGRSESLSACLLSWRRDARRGSGALGSISTSLPVEIDGWAQAKCNLSAADCLDLLAIMPATFSSRDIERMTARG